MADLDGELERSQAEQHFDLPDAPFFSEDNPFVGGDEPDRPAHFDAKALEDLYSVYPDIGKGEWKLRIQRTFPKVHKGHATAGFLGEVYERVSLVDFKVQFGGGNYIVQVMKPTKAGQGSGADYKLAKEVKFQIPGEPTLVGVPTHNDREMHMAAPQTSEKVEVARLEIDDRRAQRDYEEKRILQDKLEKERRDGGRPDPMIYETTKRIMEDQRESAQQSITFFQQEAERLRGEVGVKDTELRQLREELHVQRSRADGKALMEESQAMRDMRERHAEILAETKRNYDSRIDEIKDRAEADRKSKDEDHARKLETLTADHRRTVETLTNDHRRQVDEITRRNDDQLRDITRRHDEAYRGFESAQSLERERLREDSKARIEQIERSKESELRAMKETYDSRLEDLRRSTDMQLTGVRDQTKTQVETIRESERMQSALAKENASNRVKIMEEALRRAEEEADDLRKECQELREKTHRDPIDAINEATTLAKQVGMIHASDAEKGDPSIGTQLVGAGIKMFEKAPEFLEKLAKVGADRQAAAVQQQQAAFMTQQQAAAIQQQQAMAQAAAAARGQLPQGPQAQPQQRPAPNPYAAATPFGGVAMPSTTPVPFAPTASNVPSPIQPNMAVDAPNAVAPFGGPANAGPDAGAAPMGMPPTMPEAGGQPPGPPAQPPTATGTAPDPENVRKFFGALEDAIRQRQMPPETFASGVILEIGRDNTRVLLQRYTPQAIVETARQMSPHSRIGTRDGQQYVEAMWRSAAEKLQAP